MVPTTLYVISMLFSGYEEQPNLYMGGLGDNYRAAFPESAVMNHRSPEPKKLNLGNSTYKRHVFQTADEIIVKLGEYPSVVLIKNFHGDPAICSGFIVNKNWAATAAQCVYGVDPKDIVVASATLDLHERRNDHEVDEIIIHEDFEITTLYNDIAVVKVSTSFKFGQFVQPAYLPTTVRYFVTAPLCSVVGWGTWQNGEPISTALTEQRVKIPNECFFGSLTPNENEYKILPSQLCGMRIEERFNGDAGSPLFLGREIYGILSWTEQCDKSRVPEIYTKVKYYLAWLEFNTATYY